MVHVAHEASTVKLCLSVLEINVICYMAPYSVWHKKIVTLLNWIMLSPQKPKQQIKHQSNFILFSTYPGFCLDELSPTRTPFFHCLVLFSGFLFSILLFEFNICFFFICLNLRGIFLWLGEFITFAFIVLTDVFVLLLPLPLFMWFLFFVI